MHKISGIPVEKMVLSSEKGSSLAHCVPLFKRNRCKSALALKRSITKDEAVEAVSVRDAHEATPRGRRLLQCSQCAGPMERALTNVG